MSSTAVTVQARDDERGLFRAFLAGSLIGFIGVFLVLGGITYGVGMGLGPAIGVGLFAAFWGGPGFGGMMGAVLHHSRNDAP